MSTELNNGTNVAANNKIMLINDKDVSNTTNNKNITSIVENKTTTDEKNNNTNATNNTNNNTSSNTKYSLSINNNILKYIAISITVIMLIVLAIYVTYKTYSTQNKNLGTLLEEARKDVAILSGNVKTLEQEKQMYINKINQLNQVNNELRASQTQYDNNYSNILPMTENSYDAPDPNKEKTKVITEREAIQRLVNSKRKTVQDEIDAKKAAEEEKQQKDTRIIKSEISDNILHKPNDKSNNKHKNSDNEYDEDESKVNEILSLVGN